MWIKPPASECVRDDEQSRRRARQQRRWQPMRAQRKKRAGLRLRCHSSAGRRLRRADALGSGTQATFPTPPETDPALLPGARVVLSSALPPPHPQIPPLPQRLRLQFFGSEPVHARDPHAPSGRNAQRPPRPQRITHFRAAGRRRPGAGETESGATACTSSVPAGSILQGNRRGAPQATSRSPPAPSANPLNDNRSGTSFTKRHVAAGHRIRPTVKRRGGGSSEHVGQRRTEPGQGARTQRSACAGMLEPALQVLLRARGRPGWWPGARSALDSPYSILTVFSARDSAPLSPSPGCPTPLL